MAGYGATARPAYPSRSDAPLRAAPRAIRSRPRPSQSSCDSRIPRQTPTRTRSPSSVNPQAQSTPSFGPLGLTFRKIAFEEQGNELHLVEVAALEGLEAL